MIKPNWQNVYRLACRPAFLHYLGIILANPLTGRDHY